MIIKPHILLLLFIAIIFISCRSKKPPGLNITGGRDRLLNSIDSLFEDNRLF